MATENKTFRLSNPLKKSPNSKTNFRKENEVIKELKEKGFIKDFVLGAKYCLPTNKLNYDKINQIKNLFGEGEEEANRPYRSLSISESGWLAVSIASDKAEMIKPALEKYREFAKDDKDLFISGYGEIEFTIDFSKFGMFMDPETGDIYYPYGAFFFSDNKTLVNQFSASVACIPQRYQKIKNKRCISPITSDNWNDAKLSGSFTRHGHLVIFYVTEDIEKEPGVYHPVVNTIDIEVGVIKNYKTSEVENAYIGRVERESKCVPNEIEYLIKNVYSKYAIPSYASQQFMLDYIFSVGESPKNYILTITVDETNTLDQASYKFKSNFAGNNKAHRADVNKTESDGSASEKKSSKKNKSSKKTKTVKTSIETDVSESDTIAVTEPEAETVESSVESKEANPDVSKEASEE